MELINRSDESEDKQLDIVQKVPKEELGNILNLYGESSNMETYVKIPFLLIALLFLIHNVFLAGNSYDYDTYETIKTVELSIVGFAVLVVFIMAGIAMNKNSKVNNSLKEFSKRYSIKLDLVEEEFNALAVHLYGGRGIKLKR